MADITAALVLEDEDTVNRTTYTTASWTPSANKLILLMVTAANESVGQSISTTSVTGNGLTWVLVKEVQFDPIASDRRSIAVYRALGSSPTTGVTTINHDDTSTHTIWTFVEFDNVRLSGANGADAIVQTVDNRLDSNTTITATLATFEHANNATVGCIGQLFSGTPNTPGSGFANLSTISAAGSTPLFEFRKDNDTTVDGTSTGTGDMAAIAIELRNATGAITATVLTSGLDADNLSVYTTGSITASPNTLVLCTVSSVESTAGGDTVTGITGGGLTWVKVTSVNMDTIATPVHQLSVWRALGGSPSAGALSITLAGTSAQASWIVTEFSGIDTGGSDGANAVVQTATNASDSGTSITATLAAFANAANATVGCFTCAAGGTPTWTPGSGFTELAEAGGGTRTAVMNFRVDNDTAVDATVTVDSDLGVIALELRNLSALLTTTSAAGTAGHMGINLGW